jgi:hypothetical protein
MTAIARSPQEHAVEGVREGMQEVGVHGRRKPAGRGGAEVNAAAEAGDDVVGKMGELVGETAREDGSEDGHAERAAD